MILPARLRAGPDADLSHLPVSLDLRALSLAEGVRAALSVAALVAINEWVGIPALIEAALAAMLTCLCDAGGPIRRRLPGLIAFGLLGAAITTSFSILRGQNLFLVVACASALIFCTSFARTWGQSALQVGNVLTVVTVLALDRPADPHTALVLGAMFLAGNLWAIALTMVIWRLHPYRPSRHAVSDVYRRLAVLVADLSALLVQEGTPPDWEAHARAHRRHVRDGIEQARTLVLDTIRSRGQGNAGANALLIQVEAADQIFGALIALSDMLEHHEPGAMKAAQQCLPALRLLFAAIAHAITDNLPETSGPYREMMERLLSQVARAGDSPAFAGISAGLLERVRVAALLTTAEGQFAYGPPAAEGGLTRLLAPLRANMSWSSNALRHAIRAAVVAAPALLFTCSVGNAYAHWLTITLVLTLQPYFALTWQRALERIGGTVLGGLVATAIASVVDTPIGTAAMLFPLAVLAFSVRPVSFGIFIAGITPVVVLLSELGRPGESGLVIAAWRAGYTLLGGLLALVGNVLLWPSWEPTRLRDELHRAIRAHAAFADLELAALLGDSKNNIEAARRGAGVATNNLEASLSRALQERRPSAREELQAAMVADAGLRRIAGRLAALQYEPGLAGAADLPAWRQWLRDAFASLDAGNPLPGARPADAENGFLSRMARQVDLMDGALREATAGPAAAPSPQPPP